MIFVFIFSFLVSVGVALFTALVSGCSIIFLFDIAEFLGIILILTLFVFLSGYGKSFCRVFSSPKKMQTFSLAELRESKLALDFTLRASVYVCLFFLIVGGMYFYLNFGFRQTMGPNLALVLLSLYYMFFLVTILIALKAKLKTQIILSMNEDSEPVQTQPLSTSRVVLSVVKVFCVLVLVLLLTFLVVFWCSANEQTEFKLTLAWLLDAPSFLVIAIESLLLLFVTGNFMVFWKTVKAAFKNSSLTVSEKNVSVTAVRSLKADSYSFCKKV